MRIPKRVAILGATSLAVVSIFATAFVVYSGNAHGAGATEPQVLDDSKLTAKTTTEGGATVLPTTRTVPHWFGQTTDSHDGVTYGYNMVGANPYT